MFRYMQVPVWCQSEAEAPSWLGLHHVPSGLRQRSKLFGTGAEGQAAHSTSAQRSGLLCFVRNGLQLSKNLLPPLTELLFADEFLVQEFGESV